MKVSLAELVHTRKIRNKSKWHYFLGANNKKTKIMKTNT